MQSQQEQQNYRKKRGRKMDMSKFRENILKARRKKITPFELIN